MKSLYLSFLFLLATLLPVNALIALDINKATEQELVSELAGIGKEKAAKIVKYRKANGKFKTTDDLLKVPGIGPALISKNMSKLGLKKGKQSLDVKKSMNGAKTKAVNSADKMKMDTKDKAAKMKMDTTDNAKKATDKLKPKY